MTKCLILSGNLVQDHEFIYPYYRLLEENFVVDVALLGGKEVVGILGTKIPPNKDQKIIDIPDVNSNEYDLLIIPGGAKAMEYLRQENRISDIINEFNDANKVIGSICHGAQLLISANVVKGKKISGYYSMEDDINNAGAIYTDEEVVSDSKIITTAHYKDMGPWMKETIKQLNEL